MEYDNMDNNSKYKLIESTNKIYYFTKLSLERDFSLKVYSLTKQIKVNLLNTILEPLKYFIKECVYFVKIIPDKEKIMCVYSIMFLHYYSKFTFELANSFEDFYNQDLINMFNIHGITYYKEQDFNIFCYTFFYEMVKELGKYDYKEYKLHYCYNDIKRKDSVLSLKDYIEKIKTLGIKSALKPLIATKERIVEMVMKAKDNISFHTYGSSVHKTNSDIPSTLTNKSNVTPLEYLTKRVLGELFQEEINEKEQEFTLDIASKIDSLVDLLISQGNQKVYNVRNFICYIVEINSDLIRLFQEYEDIPDNVKLRVIIGSRNLYLIALEVFFSVYDLYNIDMNSLMSIFKGRYPFSYNESIDAPVRGFFILMNKLISEKGSKSMEDLILKAIDLMEVEWEDEINKKGKELTYYCKS